MRYLDVAGQLRQQLARGDYSARGALPSEACLAKEFHVSRATIRRALEMLRDEGLVHSRQGAGWLVNVEPVPQALGHLVPVEQAVAAAGGRPSRRVLVFEFVPAPGQVAKELGLADGDDVLHVVKVNLVDGEPFGLASVWVRGDVGSRITRAEAEQAIFLDLLPSRGVRLGRAHQTITAEAADEQDATVFGVRAGMPMIVCHRRTFDVGGLPVVSSWLRYPGHRTTFEVDFPSVEGLAH